MNSYFIDDVGWGNGEERGMSEREVDSLSLIWMGYGDCQDWQCERLNMKREVWRGRCLSALNKCPIRAECTNLA